MYFTYDFSYPQIVYNCNIPHIHRLKIVVDTPLYPLRLYIGGGGGESLANWRVAATSISAKEKIYLPPNSLRLKSLASW